MKTEKGDIGFYEENTEDVFDLEIIEKAPAYERFYYTRQLLHRKYHEFVLSLNNEEVLKRFTLLMNSQDIREGDFGKLMKRIEKWNNLESPIPLMYIEFIGIQPTAIETTAKADFSAFRDAMKQTFHPECFFINISSGVLRVPLPADTPEEKAVEMAKNYKTDEPIKAKYICVKDLKTIVIESDESHYTLSYPPVISFKKDLIIPCQPNKDMPD